MRIGVVHPQESQEYFFREGCHILEMLNQATCPELSIARARVAPGATTRPHQLLKTREHYLILSGTGRVFLGEDMEGQDVSAGDLIIIPAATTQSIQNTGPDDLVFHALCTPRFKPRNYREMR